MYLHFTIKKKKQQLTVGKYASPMDPSAISNGVLS